MAQDQEISRTKIAGQQARQNLLSPKKSLALDKSKLQEGKLEAITWKYNDDNRSRVGKTCTKRGNLPFAPQLGNLTPNLIKNGFPTSPRNKEVPQIPVIKIRGEIVNKPKFPITQQSS